MMKKYAIVLTALMFVFALGCGSSNPQGRLKIEGNVTLNGKPVSNGSIQFEPGGNQTERTQSGGVITDGRYSVDAAHGLVPGEYKVRISVMEEVAGSRVDDPDPMKAKVEFRDVAPPAFGSASTQKVTVTAGRENQFDFNM
ncbi:MAG: carboxypeptidase-like regulatory domain-containing protein [Planctomycetaceae bacterium]|jgi:hypothetical protein|nr:carboxypeptidase-like regulatory domain-containing protein [Planctomycetaceae bacterium]